MVWWLRMPCGPAHPERRPGWDWGWDQGWPDAPRGQWAGLWEAVRPEGEAHPVDPGALGEYAVVLRRRGPGAARRAFPAVAAHLGAGCPRCAADLAELLAFAAAEQDAALAAERDPCVGPGAGGLRRLLATRLVPLGLRGAPSRGLRGTSGVTRDAPTIMFQAEEATVVLRVKREARQDTVSVSGLVLPHRGDAALLRGAEARLLALAAPGVPSGGASVERIDERGGFVLEGVAPGAYRLELRSARGVLVIDDFEIGRG